MTLSVQLSVNYLLITKCIYKLRYQVTKSYRKYQNLKQSLSKFSTM